MRGAIPGIPREGDSIGRSLFKEQAKREQERARSAKAIVSELERRLDKLTLICMALWSMLSEKTDFIEEDLLERVRKIDLLDGAEDGKLQRQVAQCPQCNRVMSARHTKCLYCGAERLKLTAFDDVV